jgi:adenylosuccinate synthase
MKKNLVVVGAHWGDEGKGKIVDILSADYDCVARYQGGHNAGHTVNFGSSRHVLHLIPSGIFHDHVACVIGTGVVLDPAALLEEATALVRAGINLKDRLFISNRCNLILPYHRAIEAAAESRLGDQKIGTTLRGIGPAYEDKVGRRGLRVCDLLNTDRLQAKIREQVEFKNRQLQAMQSSETVDAEPICKAYVEYAAFIRPFVIDCSAFLNDLLRRGKSILFEGAQATMLDIDHGTFPYVTSSSASAGGASTGLGISPKHVQSVLGILKAYTTRVGGGGFPTEVHGAAGDLIRERGREYGATTGRPRRCGWFDGPAARYAAAVNGFDGVVVTKIDVLDTLKEIQFCVDYKYKGSVLKEYPADIDMLDAIEPVYKTLPGWQTSIAGARDWSKLPNAAKDYLKFLSDYLNVPLSMVSTGAERDETIRLDV